MDGALLLILDAMWFYNEEILGLNYSFSWTLLSKSVRYGLQNVITATIHLLPKHVHLSSTWQASIFKTSIGIYPPKHPLVHLDDRLLQKFTWSYITWPFPDLTFTDFLKCAAFKRKKVISLKTSKAFPPQDLCTYRVFYWNIQIVISHSSDFRLNTFRKCFLTASPLQ